MSSIRIALANNGKWRVEIFNEDRELIAFCWAERLSDALHYVKGMMD